MQNKQRSILLFQNTVKSKETYEKYLYYLENFREFYKLRDYDSMTAMDSSKLQIMVEDYVMERKAYGHSRSTLNVMLHSLQAFLDINDVELRWKKIKRLMPAQGKKAGKHAWTTSQLQTMLSYTTHPRTKAVIHFIASTGVRVGAITDIKLKDIRDMPDNCKAVCVYAEDKEEYYTFLTPEASTALNDYLEQRKKDGEHLKPESPLFRIHYTLGISPSKPMGRDSIIAMTDRVLRKSGLRQGKDNTRRDIPQNHGFRKRFNTILKTTPNINSNLVEKMMGHSTTIPLDDVYLDVSIKQLFQEFKKAIPELTINDSARKQSVIEQKEKENHTLTSKIDEINFMKKQMDTMDMELKEIAPFLPEIRKMLLKKYEK